MPRPPKEARTPHPSPRQQLGARGEALATQALVAAGYRILMPDARLPSGQIDIVAEEGDDIVFVEVKTRRTTTYGTPTEAITPTKQRHLIAAAQEYLAQHDLLAHSWRIDVVSIVLIAGPPQIEIIRHAVEG
jgi:putative endonuclease